MRRWYNNFFSRQHTLEAMRKYLYYEVPGAQATETIAACAAGSEGTVVVSQSGRQVLVVMATYQDRVQCVSTTAGKWGLEGAITAKKWTLQDLFAVSALAIIHASQHGVIEYTGTSTLRLQKKILTST